MDEQNVKDVEINDEMDGTYEIYEPETNGKLPDWAGKAAGAALAVGAAVVYAKRETIKAKVAEFKEARRVKAIERELKRLNKLGYKAEEKTE